MFRQKRKQRYEITAHVDQLTDGMTARDLTEHLRFWKIVDKWHPEPSTNKDFLIACLLYTSPSPRDGLLSRMPSSA